MKESSILGSTSSQTKKMLILDPEEFKKKSVNSADQSLQVLPFREVQRDGMIGCLREVYNNLRFHARVQSGVRYDLLEQCALHTAGAGKGCQNTARIEQFERQ